MDIFQFYSKSPDSVPGKGTGETLVSESTVYKELQSIKGWRKVLSNFAQTPFQWHDRQWNTVEHAFQASKYETLDPSFFASFSLDSGSDLAKADGGEAQRLRKAIKFTKEQEAEWDARKDDLLAELWLAKFTQNEDAKRVLLATGTAQLWHVIPRSSVKERWEVLELLRQELREAQTNAPKQQTEMESAAPKTKSRGRKKATAVAPEQQVVDRTEEAVATGIGGLPPPAVLVSDVVVEQEEREPVRPELDQAEVKQSSIRLCPVCNYYLYVVMEDKEQATLIRKCRNCGFHEQDTEGGLVMEMVVQEKSSESYKIQLNEFTHRDPCLPHLRKNISCPNPGCGSNQGKQEPDVIYMKYDPVNMLYIYICNVDGCGTTWRSRR